MAVALLIVLCFLAFAPVLRAYFVADDYVPMAYLYQGFSGHPAELLARLFQPWQDPTVQLMYRPVCDVTMMLDYALFGANPVGFHLSNLFWHICASIAFYLVCKEMATGLQGAPPALPLAAAGLFATSPLHTETVAWMIGRVDSVCAAFYFLSILCFLKGKRTLGLLPFALALLSKEMAVTLPAVLVAHGLIVERRKPAEAVRASLGYWALLIPYFAMRLAVLGTAVGGYIGSVGAMFSRMLEERFLHCRWDKVFYPYSDYAMNESNILVRALRVIYMSLAVLALIRWRGDVWGSPAFRMMAFCAIWLALCIIPAVPVWYLNSALTGGRFLYLGSAPLMLILALVLLQPARRLGLCGVGALLAVFCCMSVANSKVWVRSGQRAVKLHAAVVSVLQRTPSDKKLVLLNMPKQANDEHLFYTAQMYGAFFKPPFTATDLSDRVACTQPNFYLPETPNNVSRLRRMAESGRFEFYSWDDNTCELTGVARDMVLAGTQDVQGIPALLPGAEEGSDSFVRGRLKFAYDVSMVPGASRVVAEVSKPNCCFVHYTRTFRDMQLSDADGLRIELLPGKRGTFSIPASAVELKAHYQVRIAALDEAGNVAGTVSDPITLDTTSVPPL